MADPLAPTVPARPRGEDATEPADSSDAPASAALPDAIRRATPVSDPLEVAVAEARAAAALFGEAAAVQVGRYRLIERAGAGGMGVVWSAWDPDLNRGVALKLASSGDEAARARARDEGRALARLSHPNVVPIYDVFEAPEGVFLVMELVKGQTLRAVAREGASVAELVRAYRQCGEGLAAAHDAGLVHRDFKPDNAILGADGRVRVLDFGLAHAVTIDDGASPGIAGTPAYMAPEQRRGDPLTAAVDQWALAVSLREAVGSRGPVPRWLEPILARATAAEPGARYPSMTALLAALALDPATRWRRRAVAAGAVVALAAVAGAFTIGRANKAPSPCEGSAAAIAASWGGARRAAASAHLAALTGGYARESAPRITDALDGYAAGWVTVHRASCRAHERHELSSTAYDRRTACLARRRTALATVGELADGATVDALPGLVLAVGGLADVAGCEDDDALASPVSPPVASQRDLATVIADLIARVDVERDAGDIDAATRDAEAALTRARALAYAPLVARALVARGRIALATTARGRGRDDFVDATRRALEVGDEPLAIEAYARAAFAIATTGQPDAAVEGLPLIEAITSRLGDHAAFARALLHHNVGTVELAKGDRPGARTLLEQARRDAVGLTDAAAIEMTVVLQSLMIAEDDDDARRRLGDDLVTMRTRLLGANHPLTLDAALIRGGLIADRERGREALTAPCNALAELHPSHQQDIRECTYELLWRAAVAGDHATTTAMARRILDLAVPDDVDSRVPRARAYLAIANSDAATALSELATIAPVPATAPWWRRMTDIDVALAVALAELARGDRSAAAVALDRGDQIARSIVGAPPTEVGHRVDAIAALRRRL